MDIHVQQKTNTTRVLVGVDIGGTKTAVVFCNEPLNILWRREFPTRPESGPDHAIEKILHLIYQGQAETGYGIHSIGVSCGGPLDRHHGIIQRPPNLWTWDDVPIKALLEEEFAIPCALENDANAGAIAEHRFGAGRGSRHMVFLTLGTGLGAGLILNGQIFRGASSLAGEIGHVRLTETGPNGYDKAGSVEGWASGAGMALHAAETIRAAIANGEPTILADRRPDISARDIGAAMAEGDKVAARIVQETGRRLGEALALLVDILNPERIVVGGLALRFGDYLLEPARKRMQEEALPTAAAACSVVPAALGEQIGDAAAICIAMGLLNVD
ncbi:ROK family protein [Edaphobacter sp. HDX4]|uniref:ROK family protein n=1 Tax=Edaphobacter sp. HDX4 TaxID=2794064 RepID=UPI002FE52864